MPLRPSQLVEVLRENAELIPKREVRELPVQ